MRRKRNTDFSSLSAAVQGCDLGRHLGLESKISLRTVPPFKIVQKARRSQLYNFLKTESGSREVDLCPALVAMLKEYLDNRLKTLKSDLLFQSRSGKPLQQSNILRRTLHPILENFNKPKCGCHVFRRFRVTHLRKNGVPEDLIHFWAGHAGKSVNWTEAENGKTPLALAASSDG
jgi:integrase